MLEISEVKCIVEQWVVNSLLQRLNPRSEKRLTVISFFREECNHLSYVHWKRKGKQTRSYSSGNSSSCDCFFTHCLFLSMYSISIVDKEKEQVKERKSVPWWGSWRRPTVWIIRYFWNRLWYEHCCQSNLLCSRANENSTDTKRSLGKSKATYYPSAKKYSRRSVVLTSRHSCLGTMMEDWWSTRSIQINEQPQNLN